MRPAAELISSHPWEGGRGEGQPDRDRGSGVLCFSSSTVCFIHCKIEIVFRIFTNICHNHLLWLALTINYSTMS